MKKRSAINGPLASILLLIVLLPAVYMGAYYGMLEGPMLQAAESPLDDGGRLLVGIVPSYRIESEPVSYAFRPAHQLDRLIRPEYWGD